MKHHRIQFVIVLLMISLWSQFQIQSQAASQNAPKPTIMLQPSTFEGMFDLYQDNRNQGVGNYITVDFLLTAYRLLLSDVLTDVETRIIHPNLTELVNGMLKQILLLPMDQPDARTACAYLSVLQNLLNSETAQTGLPPQIKSLVDTELENIRNHAGVLLSPVMAIKEDYSQYVPRGKYTATENQKRYFMAMMYAGRMGFYVRESRATGVTPELADMHAGAAVLLSQTIARHEDMKKRYDGIARFLNFWVGPEEDLTVSDYQGAGSGPPSEIRRRLQKMARDAGRLPRIISMPVDPDALKAEGLTLPEATLCFRLIGQRYTPASDMFQHLTGDVVGAFTGKPEPVPYTLSVINGRPVRGFPTVLDVMAALKSPKAQALLLKDQETAYSGYSSQSAQAAKNLSSLLTSRKTDDLSTDNLRLMQLLTTDKNARPEWLNAALGFWIQERHTNVLYAKQSYTAVSKSIGGGTSRGPAALEPALEVYKALLGQIRKISGEIKAVSESRGKSVDEMAISDMVSKIGGFQKSLERIADIANRQAGKSPNSALSQADHDYLNALDHILASFLNGTDHPIVVDIHTEPNSRLVSEVGTGYPLIDTVPLAEKNTAGQVPRGARFTCYEFKQPMDQRLTDEDWRKMLKDGKAVRSLTK
jgi:hypothetical protein